MSRPHDIDNDETLFHFDPFDARQSFVSPQLPLSTGASETTTAPYTQPPATMSSHDESPTSGELAMAMDVDGQLEERQQSPAMTAIAKGKSRTAIPVPIRPSTIVHDLFDMSFPTTSSMPCASPSSYQGELAFASPSSAMSMMAFSPSSTLTSGFSSSSPDHDNDFDSRFRQRALAGRGFSMERLHDTDNDIDLSSASSYTRGKGKEKENSSAAYVVESDSYPSLPPLSFSAMELELDYTASDTTPCTPGPSSYGTLYSSPPAVHGRLRSPAQSPSQSPSSSAAFFPDNRDFSIPLQESPALSPPPGSASRPGLQIARCRSLGSLTQPLTPSLGAVSTAITSTIATTSSTGLKFAPSNISRQLIGIQVGDKRDANLNLSAGNADDSGTNTNSSTDALDLPPAEAGSTSILDIVVDPTAAAMLISKLDLQTIEREPGSCPPAWYTVSKPSHNSTHLRNSPFPTPRALLKGKSRSQSSPYPISYPVSHPISALDIVPVTSTDIFQPIPIVIRNYFDLVLPKELRICILRKLVELHEGEHEKAVREGRYTSAKAGSSRGRWVGRDKGIRELFKLSRVSKSWQSLVFDGELWTHIDLCSFPGLPPTTVVRIVESAGTFIRSLNVTGHVHLLPESMSSITDDLCLSLPDNPLAYTQLTTLNLQGCFSLTTRSLHHLLVRSKYLETLCVRGLPAVTNTTCDIIGNFCPNITSLNMNRCVNMDAEGVRSLAGAANLRGEHLKLKELRLCALRHVSDSMMRALGRAAPFLEVLDLSYARHLHNSALEAFVACEEFGDNYHLGVDTILVSARDLGRETTDSGPTRFRRRVTHLRHLALSFCVMLTDNACSNLAWSVPKLEFLELAGIGQDLKDGGLVRLIEQTPYIRRLDLEDASDIGNTVIAALTPGPVPITATSPIPPKQPGHALQHLNISYASNITDDALLSLIRKCTNLTSLEADNTRMGSTVVREFVRLSRQRKATDARVVAIDCRGIGESLVKELSPMTRPRLGWCAYAARKLGYLDGRDEVLEAEDGLMKVGQGQDECDEQRVVIKTFYSWQTVDAVKAAREKRRKSTPRRNRVRDGSDDSFGSGLEGLGGYGGGSEGEGSSAGGAGVGGGGRSGMRWWSPGGRRTGRSSRFGAAPRAGNNSPPILPELNSDGCVVM